MCNVQTGGDMSWWKKDRRAKLLGPWWEKASKNDRRDLSDSPRAGLYAVR